MVASLILFASRLTRFDPAALVRLRGGYAYGMLPWSVLVSVPLPAADPAGDAVFSAADIVTAAGNVSATAELTEPESLVGELSRRDMQWRAPLPPSTSRIVEVVPAGPLRSAAVAAANTLRELTGRSGERAIRDALLDHQVITGTSDVDGTAFSVPQRLVQAMVRMGLIDVDSVEIRVVGPWTGLSSPDGQAWLRSAIQLTVRTVVNQPIGR